MKLKEEEWTLFNLKKKVRQDKLQEVHLKIVKEEVLGEKKHEKMNYQKNKIILDLFIILINDLINAKKFRLKQD